MILLAVVIGPPRPPSAIPSGGVISISAQPARGAVISFALTTACDIRNSIRQVRRTRETPRVRVTKIIQPVVKIFTKKAKGFVEFGV